MEEEGDGVEAERKRREADPQFVYGAPFHPVVPLLKHVCEETTQEYCFPEAKIVEVTNTVQRCLALRPPHHLTYYLRLAPNTSKGITKTDANTLVYVVLEGQVTVVMDFIDAVNVISKGDTFYVPMNSSFNILNTSQQRAELYVFQYKYITRPGKKDPSESH